jgi:hypothetical protein
MNTFKIKSAVITTLLTSTVCASPLTKEEDQDKIIISSQIISGGDFDALGPDVIGHVASCMPTTNPDDAQILGTVCKFFYAYFVPKMWFCAGSGHCRSKLDGYFVKKHSLRIVTLSLHFENNFHDIDLQSLTNLTGLDLSRNKTITNTALEKHTKITTLMLNSKTKITDIGLMGLTNLTYLDLSSNAQITNKGVAPLTNLAYLSLDANKLITNEVLTGLTNLKDLNLHNNHTIDFKALNHLGNWTMTKEGYAFVPNFRSNR